MLKGEHKNQYAVNREAQMGKALAEVKWLELMNIHAPLQPEPQTRGNGTPVSQPPEPSLQHLWAPLAVVLIALSLSPK
jgi:hypothetical protein